MPLAVATRLLETLRPCTSTSDDCWFAVWHGFGALNVPAGPSEAFSVPGREFYVARGELADVVNTLETIAWDYQSPSLWWPADRAWCVATEVDFAWTYVGGSAGCLAAVRRDPELEAIPAAIDEGNHMESLAAAAARWPVRSSRPRDS